MAPRLAGKTAIVTGSTKGIGLGIARAFVQEGARVVVNSRSAEECERQARALGPAASPIAADLSRSDEVRRLAREGAAALGGAPTSSSIMPGSRGWRPRRPCPRPTTATRSTSTSTLTSC